MTLLNSFVTVSAVDLQKELEQEQKNSGSQFEPLLKNEFKVTAKPDESGAVILRILPAMANFKTQNPHVTMRHHTEFFHGGRYESLCAGFSSGNCAVCNFIKENKIWEKDSKFNKLNYGEWDRATNKPAFPRLQAREEVWVNVYIVDDQVDPSNNGKVFQYKLPRDIEKEYFSLIKGDPAISQAPSEPYDLQNGRNLYVKYYKGSSGFRTYEDSKFLDKSPIKNKMGVEILQDADAQKLFMEQLENIQDLNELIDVDSRMYTKEESQEKFDAFMKVVDEETGILGGKTANLQDGFDSVALKANDSKEKVVDHEEFDKLTSGAYDTDKKVEVVEKVETKVDSTQNNELDELLGELDLNL